MAPLTARMPCTIDLLFQCKAKLLTVYTSSPLKMHFAHWLACHADRIMSSSSWKGKTLGANDKSAQWVFSHWTRGCCLCCPRKMSFPNPLQTLKLKWNFTSSKMLHYHFGFLDSRLSLWRWMALHVALDCIVLKGQFSAKSPALEFIKLTYWFQVSLWCWLSHFKSVSFSLLPAPSLFFSSLSCTFLIYNIGQNVPAMLPVLWGGSNGMYIKTLWRLQSV